MGHRLTNKGVQPEPSKVATFSRNVQSLAKFCQNLSQTVLPLRDLTRDDTEFLLSGVHGGIQLSQDPHSLHSSIALL